MSDTKERYDRFICVNMPSNSQVPSNSQAIFSFGYGVDVVWKDLVGLSHRLDASPPKHSDRIVLSQGSLCRDADKQFLYQAFECCQGVDMEQLESPEDNAESGLYNVEEAQVGALGWLANTGEQLIALRCYDAKTVCWKLFHFPPLTQKQQQSGMGIWGISDDVPVIEQFSSAQENSLYEELAKHGEKWHAICSSDGLGLERLNASENS